MATSSRQINIHLPDACSKGAGVAKPVPEGTRWRCNGTGEVKCYDDSMTPCGACLGTKIPPKPCPKCGSIEVKILTYGGRSSCWHCRNCGFQGPWHINDFDSMRAWNALPRKVK